MDLPDSDPFQCHADSHNNACINNGLQFVDLAECYLQSGDALVTTASHDRAHLDTHIHAICFLYRHSLELILKDLAWKSHYVATGVKRYAGHDWRELGRHGLRAVWKSGSASAKQVLGADFPLSADGICQVDSLLECFERHDPDSYAFRYPIGKKKSRPHASLTNVNLRVLRDSVRQVFDQLREVVGRIDYCYDRAGE